MIHLNADHKDMHHIFSVNVVVLKAVRQTDFNNIYVFEVMKIVYVANKNVRGRENILWNLVFIKNVYLCVSVLQSHGAIFISLLAMDH